MVVDSRKKDWEMINGGRGMTNTDCDMMVQLELVEGQISRANRWIWEGVLFVRTDSFFVRHVVGRCRKKERKTKAEVRFK